MGTPVLHKLGQKIVIFRGFSKIFSELGVVLGQNLGQIMSNVVKKIKKTGNIIRFFSSFTWDYLLKQEIVVVKPPEWKFMAIIARNAKF